MIKDGSPLELIALVLIKIEGQLGHANAIAAARLELDLLSKREDIVFDKKLSKTFMSVYTRGREDIDKYVANAIKGLFSDDRSEDSDDIISKMNDEKEHSHED